MTSTTELIVLPSLQARLGVNGGYILTQKYLDGINEYARLWPGRTTTLVELNDQPGSDMDQVEVIPQGLPFNLELRPPSVEAQALRLRDAAVVLAFLSPKEVTTAQLCSQLRVPLVFISEYSLKTELQIIDSEVSNPLRRWRRKRWASRAERTRISALKTAAGIQCSGAPTFDAYRHANANAIIFFDNRVPQRDVINEEELARKVTSLHESRPLHLVFGGRLIAMKGVHHLPLVACELKRLGVPFTMEIYGSGALEGQIAHDLEKFRLQEVTLRGPLDFRRGWLPLLKQRMDLFLCCHLQGDPSSTYPEVMSCGVPIVGYDNDAFRGIVTYSGAGWLCPLGNPQKLAAKVAYLHSNRSELADSSSKGRLFAAANAFEATFARRINHLVHLSRLPERTRNSFVADHKFTS